MTAPSHGPLRSLCSPICHGLLAIGMISCTGPGASRPPETPTAAWSDLSLDRYRSMAKESFGKVVQENATTLHMLNDEGADPWRDDLRLFRLCGALTSEDLDRLLASLRTEVSLELTSLGAELGEVEDRPLMLPMSALLDTIALSFGRDYRWYQHSLRGFRLPYRQAGNAGAVDVIAMQFLNPFEKDEEHWALGFTIHEPIAR